MSIQKVLLFSGGRTSGYMLRRMLDAVPDYRNQFITCFCNTGKERLETLDFVHEVETRWQVSVVWLEYHRVPAQSLEPGIFPTPRRNQNLARAAAKGENVHWFKQVTYETASRNGEPFDELLNVMTVLPNVTARNCSAQLKIRSTDRYLLSRHIKEYEACIGIRKDEEHRKVQVLASVESREHPVFPLCDWGVTETDVMAFWRDNDFDLQLQSYEGNCDLCFLKAKWKRLKIAQEHPELLRWWKDWESVKAQTVAGDGKYFRRGEPVAKLEKLALTNSAIASDPTDQDIPCTCVEKAFAKDEDE